MAQIVGGAALLAGLYYTSQTLRTTQEGQITDRYTRAIDQLGKDTLDVRLGGIYALERIAKDSPKDHWQIMEVLTAYVREHVPWPPKKGQPPENEPGKPTTDIQAILTVIGRRVWTQEEGERQRLDLRNTDLRGADLRGAHLERAWLMRSHLEGAFLTSAHLMRAQFYQAHLEGARLDGANLNEAGFPEAHLEGAILMGTQLGRAHLQRAHLQRAILGAAFLGGAHLEGANLGAAILRGAHFMGATLTTTNLQYAHLEEAHLQGTDLRTVIGLTQDQVNKACVHESTQLPTDLKKPDPCPAKEYRW